MVVLSFASAGLQPSGVFLLGDAAPAATPREIAVAIVRELCRDKSQTRLPHPLCRVQDSHLD